MILAFALAAAAQAATPDWRPVGFVGPEDLQGVAYIDVASIAKPDDTTRDAVILTVFASPRKAVDGSPFDAVRATYRIDCVKLTGRTTGAVALAKGRELGPLNADPVAVSFDGDRPFARVAQIACKDDKTAVRSKVTGSPAADAAQRFAWQGFARESLTKASWHRVDANIYQDKRLALFLDRDSIARQPDGRYLVATMQIDEGVPDVQRFNYATLIDCAAKTRTNVYSQYYRFDGSYVGTVIPRVPTRPLTGRFIGYLYAPVCSNDWSKTRAFTGTPAEIAANPDALKPEAETQPQKQP